MKIGFFITARLKSTRLQHKIFLNLNGKTVLDRVIERCKNTIGIDGVVLCTSTNNQDSILYNYALKNGIQFYPGDETDVLQRLSSAADYYGYDAFLSITADNPLFSIYTSQLLVDWYKKEPFDFIFSKGLPIGCNTTLLNAQALKIAIAMKKQSDTEIWGPFVNRPDFFKIGQLNILNCPFKEEKRLTIDYHEDYKLFCEIYNHFDTNYIPDIHEVINIFQKHPELWEINKKHHQKFLTDDEIQTIRKTFDDNIAVGQKKAKEIGKVLNPGFKELNCEF